MTGHISWIHVIKSGICCDVDLTNREIGPLFLRNELIEIPAETNHILELLFSDFGGGTQNVRWAQHKGESERERRIRLLQCADASGRK